MVPEVGIAPTSQRLQRCANLPQLLGELFTAVVAADVSRRQILMRLRGLTAAATWVKMVVPRGNAPRSSGYQPGALLLSYETMADGVGIAPTQPGGSLGFRDRGITALPTIRRIYEFRLASGRAAAKDFATRKS